MNKQETKVEYELMLRRQTDTEVILDVREDTVDSDGEPMGEEYVEGFIYDGWSLQKNYGDAVTKFLELRLKYPDAYVTDEILEEAKDFKSKILNLQQANIKKGGDGAFFVYLRKNKN